MGIKIMGTGHYLPEIVVDNQAFTKFLDTSDEWITTRTGIKKRHVSNGEFVFQMGAKAAQQALKNAKLTPADLDMILVSCCSVDFFFPSVACLVGKEIGAGEIPCMDLNAACAGYVYALDMAEKYLRDDHMKHILIVSSEMLSRVADYGDRSTCVLFGDGAAATVVTKSEGLYASYLTGKPEDAEKIFCKLPKPEHPFMQKEFDYGNEVFNQAGVMQTVMAGSDVYKFATAALPAAMLEVTKRAGIPIDSIDLLIPHQANIRIIQTAMKKLDLPPEKCYINIQDYGNISSACIPLAISELVEQNKIKPGDTIGLVGFGGGLVVGACVFDW